MTKNDIAKHTLNRGDKYPYDPRCELKDWAHRAARGVIADLEDRGGIKHELAAVVADVRDDIVAMHSEIIRVANDEQPEGSELARLRCLLHKRENHPDFEYAITTGQRKNFDEEEPEGEGWERNIERGDNGWERFEYHEEAYWRRFK